MIRAVKGSICNLWPKLNILISFSCHNKRPEIELCAWF